MHKGLKLITAPSDLAVDLDDVKNYLKVTGSAEDADITAFIYSATEVIERYLHRALLTQTWSLWLDRFPGSFNFDSLHDGVQEGKLSEYFQGQSYIDIPLFPLQSVSFLKTYDDDGTAYTMSSSEYIVDTVSEPGRLSLKTSTTWPSTELRPVNGIEIRFLAGYGTSSDIPQAIVQAIKDTVAKFYESRGCSDADQSIPSTALALLSAYRVYRIG